MGNESLLLSRLVYPSGYVVPEYMSVDVVVAEHPSRINILEDTYEVIKTWIHLP